MVDGNSPTGNLMGTEEISESTEEDFLPLTILTSVLHSRSHHQLAKPQTIMVQGNKKLGGRPGAKKAAPSKNQGKLVRLATRAKSHTKKGNPNKHGNKLRQASGNAQAEENELSRAIDKASEEKTAAKLIQVGALDTGCRSVPVLPVRCASWGACTAFVLYIPFTTLHGRKEGTNLHTSRCSCSPLPSPAVRRRPINRQGPAPEGQGDQPRQAPRAGIQEGGAH